MAGYDEAEMTEPRDRVDVSVDVARVEVFVSGPSGEFVSGLSAADFRVVVTGQERAGHSRLN